MRIQNNIWIFLNLSLVTFKIIPSKYIEIGIQTNNPLQCLIIEVLESSSDLKPATWPKNLKLPIQKVIVVIEYNFKI